MCGIAAIFAYDQDAPPVNEGELLRVREHMHFRGPDGSGLWMDKRQRVGLGHKRLAVIDLTESGAQPMSTSDGMVRIVFNGEIYNYRELRVDLEAKGYRFYSSSDTEVLLHMYRQYGEDMPQYLRGMFAFAIWDERKRGMLLVRDPFGIKPLYVSDDGKTLRVASQVKALLAGGAIENHPAPAGHVGFYLWGYVPEPFTLYRDIRALPAGSILWVNSDGGRHEGRFFDIGSELKSPGSSEVFTSREAMRELLHDALLDSVRHHLVADVPVGVFLSAGLDSSTLVALAKEAGVVDLRTVTLGFQEFAESKDDETGVAMQIAKQYGTLHSTRWVGREEFDDKKAHLFAAMDQPSIDGANSYFVCKAAREAGLKVVLSGLGGDELFGGYSSFKQVPLIASIARPFRSLGFVGRGFRLVSGSVVKRFTSPKYSGLLEYGPTFSGAYLLRRGLFMPWELPSVVSPEFASMGLRDLELLGNLDRTTLGVDGSYSRVMALELTWYMRNQLLRDSDWASMAHSLELRVPLVDVALFRMVARAIADGHQPTKWDLASAPKLPLPRSAFNRQKTGFSVPIRHWLPVGLAPASARGLRPWAVHVMDKADAGNVGAFPILRSNLTQGSHEARRRICLLAGDLCTHGGIQSFMRRILDVMKSISAQENVESRCLSLNDRTEAMRRIADDTGATYLWGGGRSKARMVLRALLSVGRVDVVIVGHVGLSPLALLMKLTGRLRAYYVQLHGVEAWRKVSAIDRIAMRAADGVLATTHFTAQECAKHNKIPEARFTIIPLCANESVVTPATPFALRGEFKLLCVARQDESERYKGFETIFDALAMLGPHLLAKVHLNLIGTGNDQARLRSVVGQQGLRDQVTFWNSLSEDDLAAAYACCDVFVMPSRKEGFGIVFLEAMRHSKPCIGGWHGGTPDVIEHGKSGFLVPYGDKERLAECISLLMEDSVLRAQMGSRGRELVRSKFSQEKFESGYRRLFSGAQK